MGELFKKYEWTPKEEDSEDTANTVYIFLKFNLRPIYDQTYCGSL